MASLMATILKYSTVRQLTYFHCIISLLIIPLDLMLDKLVFGLAFSFIRCTYLHKATPSLKCVHIDFQSVAGCKGVTRRFKEPSHEIIGLFVLRKLIFQTRMRSHLDGARCLIFGRTLLLFPYFMFANSEGSDETARMRRLA